MATQLSPGKWKAKEIQDRNISGRYHHFTVEQTGLIFMQKIYIPVVYKCQPGSAKNLENNLDLNEYPMTVKYPASSFNYVAKK